MRKLHVSALILIVAVVGCVPAMVAGGIVASTAASGALTKGALSAIGGSIEFDSVTWKRAEDSTSIIVRGKLTWHKSRRGAGDAPYWDVNRLGLSADLLNSNSEKMASVHSYGIVKAWDDRDSITMVPDGQPVTFEFQTTQISANILRDITSIKVTGVVTRTM